MKNLIVGIIMTVFVIGGGTACATVLTFDDVGNTTSLATIHDGYGGFDWNNMG